MPELLATTSPCSEVWNPESFFPGCYLKPALEAEDCTDATIESTPAILCTKWVRP